MPNFITISEYAQIKGVHKRTVYRWIERNDIIAKKFNGKWHIQLDEDKPDSFDTNAIVANLMSEKRQKLLDNEYLKEQLAQAQMTIAEMQKDRQRSDTIIMQLTKQLEQQTLLLEDMRGRSIWKRFKTALGFASS